MRNWVEYNEKIKLNSPFSIKDLSQMPNHRQKDDKITHAGAEPSITHNQGVKLRTV